MTEKSDIAKNANANSNCKNNIKTSSHRPPDTGGGGGNKTPTTISKSRPLALPNKQNASSDSEEGFLSNSPDSVKSGEILIAASNAPINGSSSTTVTITPSPITASVQAIQSTPTTSTTNHNNSNNYNNNNNNNSNNIGMEKKVGMPPPPISLCTNPGPDCVTLKEILDSFKLPLSEEQAWALIYQFMSLYRRAAAAASTMPSSNTNTRTPTAVSNSTDTDATTSTGKEHRRSNRNRRCHIFTDLEIPDGIENLNIHRDGTVHCSWPEAERRQKEKKMRRKSRQQQRQQQQQQQQMQMEGVAEEFYDDEHDADNRDAHAQMVASHKKILRKVAVIVYTALDYNLQADEQCQMSTELEELITHMTADSDDECNEDDCIDEGIDEGDKRWDDEAVYNDENYCDTKEFDYVLEACKMHVKPTAPDDHYRAVCRAIVTETIELRIFLQQVLNDGADNLHLKADSQTSKQELAKLGFNDWARFWVQVIDELRRGVRLKKNTYSRTPIEYQLTPYEILMEDIRSKKYQLRKVMVNGDIPPRVKKDAHAVILEFIRSRPPLKKASERELPPPVKRTPSPREQLMDSIRKGQTLKHIQPPIPERLKDRLLPPQTTATVAATAAAQQQQQQQQQQHQQYNNTITTSVMMRSAGGGMSGRGGIHGPEAYHSLSAMKLQENMETNTAPRSKQRLIKVDFALLQDDDVFFSESAATSRLGSSSNAPHATHAANSSTMVVNGVYSQPKMPPYPIGGYMIGGGVTGAGACGSRAAQGMAGNAAMQPSMPSLTTQVLRRTKDNYTTDEYHRFYDNALEYYDLATQCESRRASQRRHTIVGCQSNLDETRSMPPSRPSSRQSDNQSVRPATNSNIAIAAKHEEARQNQHNLISSNNNIINNNNTHGMEEHPTPQHHHHPNHPQRPSSAADSRSASSIGGSAPWQKSFLDERTWQERGEDRLSLTLEEIVHIRSVMTKAELEGLPVGVRVKEDVERRKVCFLCLRTRFSIFGPWGIQCKLCQRTVCSKCHTKMRIPSEQLRNVPLVLISPSLLASPAGSSTPSPSHHRAHSSSTGNILDESFPKTLIERLLRTESERKAIGSAPASPKNQRSNMSTPGTMITPASAVAHGHYSHGHGHATGQAIEALPDTAGMTVSYTAGCGVAAMMQHRENQQQQRSLYAQAKPTSAHMSVMSRSVEGPRSLPANSPARTHSNCSTLERKSKFARAFMLSSSGTQLSQDQKENVRCEQVPVCNDCKGLVMEITRSSKQTRSSARNRTLQNLTLDLSPVYK